MSDTELLPKPKAAIEPEPVRRIEIFTGTGRRRRWTPEQKARIVAETYGSGESVSAVARRHGLTAQQLFAWRRNEQRPQADASRMAFAPVVLETSRPDAGAAADASPVIEIVIGAATVRIPAGTQLASLQVVLRALTAA